MPQPQSLLDTPFKEIIGGAPSYYAKNLSDISSYQDQDFEEREYQSILILPIPKIYEDYDRINISGFLQIDSNEEINNNERLNHFVKEISYRLAAMLNRTVLLKRFTNSDDFKRYKKGGPSQRHEIDKEKS